MKRTAAEVEKRLSELKVIRALKENPGWQKLREIMQEGRDRRAHALVSGLGLGVDGKAVEIPESDTRRLRAEVRTIDWIVNIANVSDEQLVALADDLEKCRAREERLAQAEIGRAHV